jgi:WD40 repeat protein
MKFNVHDEDKVHRLVLSPNAENLAAQGYRHCGLRLWRTDDRALEQTLNSSCSGLAFTPDGKTLAVADSRGSVRFWRVSDGKELAYLERDGSGMEILAYSPDGALFAGALGREIQLWPSK